MKDSPSRQVLSCKSFIKEATQAPTDVLDSNVMIFSDCCRSSAPLSLRPQFKAALQEVLKRSVDDRVIFVENAARVGRELPVVQEAHELCKLHNIMFYTTSLLKQFSLSGVVGDLLREEWSKAVMLEKQQLRSELTRTKELRQRNSEETASVAIESLTFGGVNKFDGRMSLINQHPEVVSLISDNLNLSITQLTELIFRKGITANGMPYGRSTVYRNRKFIVSQLIARGKLAKGNPSTAAPPRP